MGMERSPPRPTTSNRQIYILTKKKQQQQQLLKIYPINTAKFRFKVIFPSHFQ